MVELMALSTDIALAALAADTASTEAINYTATAISTLLLDTADTSAYATAEAGPYGHC